MLRLIVLREEYALFLDDTGMTDAAQTVRWVMKRLSDTSYNHRSRVLTVDVFDNLLSFVHDAGVRAVDLQPVADEYNAPLYVLDIFGEPVLHWKRGTHSNRKSIMGVIHRNHFYAVDPSDKPLRDSIAARI